MAAALVLLVAAPAAAETRLERMQAVASQVFPEHCAPVTVETGGLVNPPPAIGEAYSPLLGHNRCHIRLRDDWASWQRSRLCEVVVHEYGHLAGLGHSPDPQSIMYPQVSAMVPGCAVYQKYEARETKLVYKLRRADRKRQARRIQYRLDYARSRLGP